MSQSGQQRSLLDCHQTGYQINLEQHGSEVGNQKIEPEATKKFKTGSEQL